MLFNCAVAKNDGFSNANTSTNNSILANADIRP